jgi:tol-pal system protein YbgF
MKRRILKACGGATALVAVALAVATPPVFAQRLSLAERVARLEQQSDAGNQGNSISLVNQVQALQSQVQALQGQVEELRHQVEQSSRHAKDQYIDLDSRIGRLEGGSAGAGPGAAPGAAAAGAASQLNDVDLGTPAPPSSGGSPGETGFAPATTAPPPPAAGQTMPADQGGAPLSDETGAPPAEAGALPPDGAIAEKAAYDDAFSALKDGRYAESARRFQGFLDTFPDSTLAGNAAYWLGESYYVTQNYRVALETFQNLLDDYPNNQKAPDALLKVGYCQFELKQWDAARTTLTEVTQKYPDTTVARLADGRLRALSAETADPTTP